MKNNPPSPEEQAFHADMRAAFHTSMVAGGAQSTFDEGAEFGPRLEITLEQYDALQKDSSNQVGTELEPANRDRLQQLASATIMQILPPPAEPEPEAPQSTEEWEAAVNRKAELIDRIDGVTGEYVQFMEGFAREPGSENHNPLRPGDTYNMHETTRSFGGGDYLYRLETDYSHTELGTASLDRSQVLVGYVGDDYKNMSARKQKRYQKDIWHLDIDSSQTVDVKDGRMVRLWLEEGKPDTSGLGRPSYERGKPASNILRSQFITTQFPESLRQSETAYPRLEVGKVYFDFGDKGPYVRFGNPEYESYGYAYDADKDVFTLAWVKGIKNPKNNAPATLSNEEFLASLRAALSLYPIEPQSTLTSGQEEVLASLSSTN